MNATKRAQVPFGLRKKLMAATSMLLVAAIMLVSTSYAWFTLSTAPEITGITTSVGANGNLEIALLTTETAADMSQITSSTGDSISATGQTLTKANITWGNLIDLSDASYGLTQIALYPAALNDADGKIGAQPLATPVYGADGRVSKVEAATITAIYDGAAFTDNGINDVGVRAVGTADDVSPRELIFKTAKTTALSKVDNAATPVRNAFIQNKGEFMSLALSMQSANTTSYTYNQLAAMKAIATGVQSALNNVVSAYSYAGLATAAATERISDDAVSLCNTELAGKTDAATLKTALETAGVNDYSTVLGTLATEQAAAKTVVDVATALMNGKADGYTYGTTASTYEKSTGVFYSEKEAIDELIIKPILGSSTAIKGYGDNPSTDNVETDAEIALSTETATKIKELYLTGGSVGALASYTSTYRIDYLDVIGVAAFTLYGGAKNVPGTLATVKGSVEGLTAPGVTSASTVITTAYGYILDFAFRTNAASSNLLLQTEAINRVYENTTGENLATMGSGSTATFTYNENDRLSADQGQKLLEAVRVVFFDPTDGNEILKVGKFTDITASSTSATGKLVLFDMVKTPVKSLVLGKNAYNNVVDAEKMVVPVSYKVKSSIQFGDATVELTTTNVVNYGDNQLITAAKFDALAEKTSQNAESKYVLGKDAFEMKESKQVETYSLKNTSFSDGSDTIVLSADTCTNYAAKVTVEEYAKLSAETVVVTKYNVTYTPAADATLVALGQNEPKKVSALVYLDGEGIDNSAVAAEAQNSGKLDLNLQFASDADLVPMENNALKNMEKTPANNP